MEKKMTKVQKFDAIAKAVEGMEFDGFDAQEFLAHEVELLNKKAGSKKATKAQEENASIKTEILSVLTSTGATVTEIQGKSEMLGGLSNQRVSALLRQLVKSGEVVKTVDKKKSYFAVAE